MTSCVSFSLPPPPLFAEFYRPRPLPFLTAPQLDVSLLTAGACVRTTTLTELHKPRGAASRLTRHSGLFLLVVAVVTSPVADANPYDSSVATLL